MEVGSANVRRTAPDTFTRLLQGHARGAKGLVPPRSPGLRKPGHLPAGVVGVIAVRRARDPDLERLVAPTLGGRESSHLADVLRRQGESGLSNRGVTVPAQGALERPLARPGPGDPDRDARALHGRGREAGLRDLVVGTPGRERLRAPHPGKDLEAFVEHPSPAFWVRLLAEEIELPLATAEAGAEDQAPPREVVQGRGLVGHLPRPAPGQRGNHRPDLDAAGPKRDGGERDPRVRVVLGTLPGDVVPDEEPVPARLLCLAGESREGPRVPVLAEV